MTSRRSSVVPAQHMMVMVVAATTAVALFAGSWNLLHVESFQNQPTMLPSLSSCRSSTPRNRPCCTVRRDNVDVQSTRTGPKRVALPLFLFGRDKEDDGDINNQEGTDNNTQNKKKKEGQDEKGIQVPFFGRFVSRLTGDAVETELTTTGSSKQEGNVVTLTRDAATTTTATASSGSPTTTGPIDDAAVYRSMAERARLEAERMDAELTLTKIDKLEKQLIKAKVKGDSVDDLQRQLDALEAKLRGGEMPSSPSVATQPTTPAVPTQAQETAALATIATNSDDSLTTNNAVTTSSDIPSNKVDEENARDIIQREVMGNNMGGLMDPDLVNFALLPDFIIKIAAAAVEMDYQNATQIDRLEVARRLKLMRDADFSYSSRPKPTFTKAEIDAAVKDLEKGDDADLMPTDKMREMAGGNMTQLAIYALEQSYYINADNVDTTSLVPDFLQPFLNQSGVDVVISNLYPECTRKEGKEPTLAQVEVLATKVLPAVKFSSKSKPLKVVGGYLIEGTHKYENGDALLEAIDKELAKTNLVDKMTVMYAPDFVSNDLFSAASDFDLSNLDAVMNMEVSGDPVLYIMGPDIVRESNRLGLTITSILGIATSWYLSIYPFLLNDGIGRRVDQQLELLEANLQPDLTWLTDLSLPLFASFIGLQLVHEAAHRLVASINGVQLTVPTFVPSLITGITSSVTTFKTPPKNKEAMFDIAAAGPLAGIVASSVALAVGSRLTLLSDPTTLPALPLDILRQSTLGGAIIDHIITGALYVPDGAPVSGIMIALHPVAVAGYISLIVNALSLLPIGTTDGGRLTLALFDRAEKQTIGSLCLLALLYFGVFGSDLFLFYFAFVMAFQTGNEIPARNERDSVGFSRVLVSIVCYGLALVSLVPFQ